MKMKIEPADLLMFPVTPRSSKASKFVAAAELLIHSGASLELYSHVAVVDKDIKFQRESYWPWTRKHEIAKSRLTEVWRLENINQHERDRIQAWCEDNMHQRYNMAGLLFGWTGIHFHMRYCSQFAHDAYKSAGIIFPGQKKDGQFTPNQIVSFERIKLVGRFGSR